jgi:hypothetical protein
MVDSIRVELRKPSSASDQTSKIATKLRAQKQRQRVRKNAKLTPIDTKPLSSGSEDAALSV